VGHPNFDSTTARRLSTVRLNPCPSLDSIFPTLLGSVKDSGAAKIGKIEKSNLDNSESLGDLCLYNPGWRTRTAYREWSLSR
jgi:hypothetical protein